jgi:RHS repeat-associated protein
LKYILNPEGYAYKVGNNFYYIYYTRDHLGNNWKAGDQINNYYPSGMENQFISQNPEKQPYKFGGKELDGMHGLNWYDFEARQLDAAIPRFTTMDPLAEKYYSVSPYAYCLNNPLRFTDPTGMDPEDEKKFSFFDWLKGLFTINIDTQNIEKSKQEQEQKNQTIEQLTEVVNLTAEALSIVNPVGSTVTAAVKASEGVEVTTGDIASAAMEMLPIVGGEVKGGIKAASSGLKTVTGVEITGFAKHGLERAIERGVKPGAILDAIKNPLKQGEIIVDDLGRQSQRFIGGSAEVVINPKSGQIISVNPTSTKKAAKLLNK